MAASASSFHDEEGVISEINVTPLVDVVLVLLIVFMITVPAIVASAPVKVDLPETAAAKSDTAIAAAKLEIFVRRQPSGEIVAYVGQQFVPLDDLKRALQATALPSRTEPVKIAAEKGLPYGQVVRVIDVVGSLGFKKIALDTQHVDREP